MAWVLAALIAAVLAYIELSSRLRSMPSMSVAPWWWAARLSLEGAIGVLGVLGVSLATDSTFGSLPQWLALGIAGGLAGPTAVRLAFANIGRGEDKKDLGLALFYDPVRGFIEDQIDDLGAANQTQWITEKTNDLLAANKTPQDVGISLATYLDSLSRLSDSERLAEKKWIKEVLDEGAYTDQDKVRALLTRAAALRFWAWLKGPIAV
jgi:hypothetical protein